jgi:hypothetical protein
MLGRSVWSSTNRKFKQWFGTRDDRSATDNYITHAAYDRIEDWPRIIGSKGNRFEASIEDI